MNYQLFSLAITIAFIGTLAFPEIDLSNSKYLWKTFKQSYGKVYQSEDEESTRFAYFLDNLNAINERNRLETLMHEKRGGKPDDRAIHGITKFSDLSQTEFESTFLGANSDLRFKNRIMGKASNTVKDDEFVDWSGIYTTPVKDQGYCGSCWAFSATEQIESDAIRTLNATYILSPEQIVQCDTFDSGCRGGWTETAYEYVKVAGGLETEAVYPYTSYHGITGQCDSNRAINVVSVEQYYSIDGEENMASYVQSTGPLSVCVDASTWNSYTVGIMYVCGKEVDHCVQAVGVYPASDGGYWKVRNSWGYAWGEAGYIRLSYGSNTCAIARDPTYTEVALA